MMLGSNVVDMVFDRLNVIYQWEKYDLKNNISSSYRTVVYSLDNDKVDTYYHYDNKIRS